LRHVKQLAKERVGLRHLHWHRSIECRYISHFRLRIGLVKISASRNTFGKQIEVKVFDQPEVLGLPQKLDFTERLVVFWTVVEIVAQATAVLSLDTKFCVNIPIENFIERIAQTDIFDVVQSIF
jgi:hypothetical protein